MNKDLLIKHTQQLLTSGKGILAADESNSTMGKRLEALGKENTEENRAAYRNMLFTTPNLNNFVTGVILYEETLFQSYQGKRHTENLNNNNIAWGIKVDTGLTELNENQETITNGLDTLESRLTEYAKANPIFTKWRATFKITDTLPSTDAINQNCKRLAKYAKIVQSFNIVPIVEPEILITGTYSIERSYEVHHQVFTSLFNELKNEDVFIPGLLLKPSMVINGMDNPNYSKHENVADLTIKCFRETLPKDLPGIVFLSGGQASNDAFSNLNNIIKLKTENDPWVISFSYGRALVNDALAGFCNDDLSVGQSNLFKNSENCSKAALGSL